MADARAAILEHLMVASYHHADDTGSERDLGIARQRSAAVLVVKAGWTDEQVQDLFAQVQPLVAYDEFIRKVHALREGSAS